MNEDTATPQPLDLIMTQLGLTNADLVDASTEQLTFKNVAKGRSGDRVTINIQKKIHTALLAAKPGSTYKVRDLFRYPMNESATLAAEKALALAGSGKVTYPEFVDLLLAAGIIGYTAEVGAHRYTFYGYDGEAYVKDGPTISKDAPGSFNQHGIESAISAAQKHQIDHPTFLKRIHEAGIVTYEVNTRKRRIDYKGVSDSYRELIPTPSQAAEAAEAAKPVAAPETAVVKAAPSKSALKKAAAAKKKRPGVVRTTRKGRNAIRNVWRKQKKARQAASSGKKKTKKPTGKSSKKP